MSRPGTRKSKPPETGRRSSAPPCDDGLHDRPASLPPPRSHSSGSAGPVSAARVHARGEGGGRLDLVLDFVHFVAKQMPLSLLLDEAPRRIAEIIGADIA